MRGLIIRKTRESLNESGLLTFERDILGDKTALHSDSRRSSRQSYTYPNGSEIVVAGLVSNGKDQKAKIMSTEYDMIFVQECTETLEEEWQKLITRLSNYRMPFQQIIGDCNPDAPTHWVFRRSLGKKLNLWEVKFEDNPRWWARNPDPALADDLSKGHWTKEGADLMKSLDSLTGVSRRRLLNAEWVQAGNLIYSEVWDPNDGSVTEEAEYEQGAGTVYWAADDGYSGGSHSMYRGIDPETGFFAADAHPRVFLLCQEKPDGHLDVWMESYACQKLTEDHIAEVLALPNDTDTVTKWLAEEPRRGAQFPPVPTMDVITRVREARYWYPERFFEEPDLVSYGPGSAEFRGKLFAAQLIPHQCTEEVGTSIQEMRTALGKDVNEFRQIRVHPRCVQLQMQMVSYANDPELNKPIKAFDDGPDALRYLRWVLRSRYSA